MKELRDFGLSVEMDHVGRSLKSQLKYADKVDATYTIVIGEDEIKQKSVICKEMKTGETERIEFVPSSIARFIQSKNE